MLRRNTIQKDLILNAVNQLHNHPTAGDIYEFIHKDHPNIGKGTVYRNLGILAEEHAIKKIEVPNGSDRYDFTLVDHYHVRCIKCDQVLDVDLDAIPHLEEKIRDTHEIKFVDYDILFRGICPACAKSSNE